MKPEQRHTTAGSFIGCRSHHRKYDAGLIEIAIGEKGADGPIRAQEGTKVLIV
jgi:hypothetical protein